MAFAKIDAEIRAFIIDEVSRCFENADNECKTIIRLVQNSKELFLRSIREIPLNLLHDISYPDAGETLEAFSTARLKTVEDTIDEINVSEIKSRFDDLKKRIIHMTSVERKGETDSLLFYLKDKIKTPLANMKGAEVQNLTLNLALVDVKLETLVNEYRTDFNPIEYKDDLFNELIYESDNPVLKEHDNDYYISLNRLYNHEKIGPKELPYLKNTLLTEGTSSGVTLDLVSLYKPTSETVNPYPIFSEYTFEGSHLLVQKVFDSLKVLLVSFRHASKLLKDFSKVSENSQFWLCDLSGSVTATTDAETQIGTNILNFMPESEQIIFDLLIFNGSLSQILSNSKLLQIYSLKWLNNRNFRERAMFLRLRMKFLQNKDCQTFEFEDKNLEILRQLSNGQKTSASQTTVNGYPKAPISEEYENEMRSKLERLEISIKLEPKVSIEFDADTEILSFITLNPQNIIRSPQSFGLTESSENFLEDKNLDLTENFARVNKRNQDKKLK